MWQNDEQKLPLGAPGASKDDAHKAIQVIKGISKGISDFIMQDGKGPILPLPIEDYLLRCNQYLSPISSAVFVHMTILLDKWILTGNVSMDRNNCHSLIAASLLVAYKFVEDDNVKLSYFLKVVGLGNRKSELLALERRLVGSLDYNINITLEEYDTYNNQTMGSAQNKQEAKLEKTKEETKQEKTKQEAPVTVASATAYFQRAEEKNLLLFLQRAKPVEFEGQFFLEFPDKASFETAVEKLRKEGYREMTNDGDEWDFRVVDKTQNIEIKGLITVLEGKIQLEPPTNPMQSVI